MQVEKKSREQLKQELLEQELVELRERNAALEQSQAESAQVRQALQETEARYRALVELCPDAILVAIDDKCVYVNPAGVRLLAQPALQNSGLRVSWTSSIRIIVRHSPKG